MEDLIYQEWLQAVPLLYLGFSIFMLFSAVPKQPKYENYNIARKIFAITSMVTGLYIGSLGYLDYRNTDIALFSVVSLCYSFFAARGFLLLFRVLLERDYFSWRRIALLFLRWGSYCAMLLFFYLVLPTYTQTYTIGFAALILFLEIVIVTVNFFRAYRRATERIDNYYSENIEPFMKWMKNIVYLIIFTGVSGGAHYMYPNWVNTLYGLLGAGAFVYTTIALNNYMLTISRLGKTIDESAVEVDLESIPASEENLLLKKEIKKWVGSKGYIKPGLTIEDLAIEIGSNRTYLSTYIRDNFNQSYRDWITDLRVEYSQELLMENPDMLIGQIADAVGYSRSSYTKAFIKVCGVNPTTWRDQHA